MSVRVRFAPSPTGKLHLGNARIALLNYLFAISQNGTFLLRIDDTDRERSDEEAVERILYDLRWLGIERFEGPVFQSRRLARYREIADALLNKGAAYRCFCTEENLREMKKSQLEKGLPPRYTGQCRTIPPERAAEMAVNNHAYTVRLKVDHNISFSDMLRGEFTFARDDVEDFIILRSDGSPTYNFASAIDDMDYKITHVIRGEDHISNTARQIAVIRSLNGKEPQYAHIPLILRGDGKPLSKRNLAETIEDLRQAGYLGAAVATYLINLGWNRAEKGPFELAELAHIFNLEDISLAQPHHNPGQLRYMNQLLLRQNMESGKLTSCLREFLAQKNILLDYPDQRLGEFLSLIADNISTLADIEKFLGILDTKFLNKEEWEHLDEKAAEILDATVALTKENELPDPALLASRTGAKKSEILMALRVATTGLRQGPPLADILKFLGLQWRLRVEMCLNYVKNSLL